MFSTNFQLKFTISVEISVKFTTFSNQTGAEMKFKTKNKLKVVVFKGGLSCEREISLESGGAVADGLRTAGHHVVEVDLQENKLPQLPSDFDVIFPVLHGDFGEDGHIQALMEAEKINFVGCNSETSELLMDKHLTAKLAKKHNIVMPESLFLTEATIPQISLPAIVKPACQGSSFGLSVVRSENEWETALENAFNYDREIVVQDFITGVEIAVGVVGGKALPVVEIIPPGEVFDFDAKYAHALGDTAYNCPPTQLSDAVCQKAQLVAEKCFKDFNCRDLTRFDFIIREDELFFIEANTIPGFTASSLVPKSAQSIGISFPEICDKLVQLAFKRK